MARVYSAVRTAGDAGGLFGFLLGIGITNMAELLEIIGQNKLPEYLIKKRNIEQLIKPEGS